MGPIWWGIAGSRCSRYSTKRYSAAGRELRAQLNSGRGNELLFLAGAISRKYTDGSCCKTGSPQSFEDHLKRLNTNNL